METTTTLGGALQTQAASQVVALKRRGISMAERTGRGV